jgi:hypothetical protein
MLDQLKLFHSNSLSSFLHLSKPLCKASEPRTPKAYEEEEKLGVDVVTRSLAYGTEENGMLVFAFIAYITYTIQRREHC